MKYYVLLESNKIRHYRGSMEYLKLDCENNNIPFVEENVVEVEEEPVYVNGSFYIKGKEPEEEISKQKEAEVRVVRNQYLADTDKYMIPDFPITEEERQQYKDYRNYLRDYTETENWFEQNPKVFEEWKEELNATEQIETMGDVYGTV